MKLAKKYENILKLMAPTWMRKLKTANWDAKQLTPQNKCILKSNATLCFIGEVHCMTNFYVEKEHDEYCEVCSKLCNTIPDRFMYGYSNKDKKGILEDVAEHVIEFHPELVTKKVQQRAHLVFKK